MFSKEDLGYDMTDREFQEVMDGLVDKGLAKRLSDSKYEFTEYGKIIGISLERCDNFPEILN